MSTEELGDYQVIKAIEIAPLFSSEVFLGQDPLDHVALTGLLSCPLEVMVNTLPTFSFLVTCQPFAEFAQQLHLLATSLAGRGVFISRPVPLGLFLCDFCFTTSKRSCPESGTSPTPHPLLSHELDHPSHDPPLTLPVGEMTVAAQQAVQ